jgi:hypothetical protein
MAFDPKKFDLAKLELSIDVDGRWRQNDVEITHAGVLAMLYRSLKKMGDGYFVCAEGLCVPLRVVDCPYVVLAVRPLADGVQLLLTDGAHVLLDPHTLTIDAANVPRCLVREDGSCARFSRAAWMQLAESIEESGEGGFILRAGGREYPLKVG